MSPLRIIILLGVVCSVLSAPVFADEPAGSPHFLPADGQHVHWAFSGVAFGEDGEQYGYFFQMDRDGSHFRSHTALFDAQTKAVILSDESEAQLDAPKSYYWRVGHSFLKFNPINDSWVFGLKTKDQKGFNFKIDMASSLDKPARSEMLRSGVLVLVGQTSLLNGHIKIGDDKKEQFVTAKHAWFRQVWMTSSQDTDHAINGVLCRFDDGSSFYSVNLPESDALRGASAGWFDPEGVPAAMSQFIRVKTLTNKDEVDIRIPSPERHVILSLGLKNASVMAGFVTGKTPGFCVLSEDLLQKA